VEECRYADWICAEGSVNLVAPQLPDLHRLFEGDDKWTGNDVDLTLVEDAAKRYSMAVSVAVLVTTEDNYLVLHRRSSHVSEGGGGLAATATGHTQWRKDFRGAARPGLRVIESAGLRELKEEMNIDVDLKKPHGIIGAAFNLLHGRDLNFYLHYRTQMKRDEVSRASLRAKDNWEVANLVFVEAVKVDVNGSLLEPYADLLPSCNRHLRAALYSYGHLKPQYR
jgi:8-oxo-dGTP pyrophosphatase MutT (NUDIX family)